MTQYRGGDKAGPAPGRTRYVVTRRGWTWVEIRSDLDVRPVRRVVETLRPYEELR